MLWLVLFDWVWHTEEIFLYHLALRDNLTYMKISRLKITKVNYMIEQMEQSRLFCNMNRKCEQFEKGERLTPLHFQGLKLC